MTTEEKWKPIAGYEDYYQVSDKGRVRSLNRCIILNNGTLYHRRGKVIKPVQNQKNGLMQVMLIVHKRYKLHYVHRLVAAAFLENPYDFPLVSHKNGNDTDNRATNLEYISRSRKLNKQLKPNS